MKSLAGVILLINSSSAARISKHSYVRSLVNQGAAIFVYKNNISNFRVNFFLQRQNPTHQQQSNLLSISHRSNTKQRRMRSIRVELSDDRGSASDAKLIPFSHRILISSMLVCPLVSPSVRPMSETGVYVRNFNSCKVHGSRGKSFDPLSDSTVCFGNFIKITPYLAN